MSPPLQALDAALGLTYLAQRGFVHADVKTPNMLVCASWAIKVGGGGRSPQTPRLASLRFAAVLAKPSLHASVSWWMAQIGDFNLSKLAGLEGASAGSLGGALNPMWSAPEVLSGSPATAASDVFS